MSRAIDAAITREASMQMTRFPGPRRSARCCNWKGAAIGAGIGAGLAFGLTGSAEGGFSPYAWRAVGVLGGVGATIGLFM